MRPSFSLGIEEEYQTVDPVTRDLRPHTSTDMLAHARLRLHERVKAELHQSALEADTGVSKTVQEARIDLFDLRRTMVQLADEHGLLLVAGATHPFAEWSAQAIYPDPRYARVVADLQLVARENLVFGLHVHVGVEDRETAVRIMNAMRYFLPHMLALSTNSPFWRGMDTGFKSYRSKVFEKVPRTGIPDSFVDYGEYQAFLNLLVKTNCLDNARKIWWDIRLHPFFQTIEVRICDIPLRTEESLALAALIQATALQMYLFHERNQDWRRYARALLMENKWRAVRYGLDGRLIDFGKEAEVDERQLIMEYLGVVDEAAGELGSRETLKTIHAILETGTGADRQLKKFAAAHDLKAVVDYMAEETRYGLF